MPSVKTTVYTSDQLTLCIQLLASTDPLYSHLQVSLMSGVSISTVKDVSSYRVHNVLIPRDNLVDISAANSLRKAARTSHLKNRVSSFPDVISPSGEVFSITNLSNFCEEHGLQASNLSSVLRGTRKSHRGWRLHDG